MIKDINDIILFARYNDPPLFFDIETNCAIRKLKIIQNINKKNYIILNDTGSKNNLNYIAILNPPQLKPGISFFKDIKTILMPFNNNINISTMIILKDKEKNDKLDNDISIINRTMKNLNTHSLIMSNNIQKDPDFISTNNKRLGISFHNTKKNKDKNINNNLKTFSNDKLNNTKNKIINLNDISFKDQEKCYFTENGTNSEISKKHKILIENIKTKIKTDLFKYKIKINYDNLLQKKRINTFFEKIAGIETNRHYSKEQSSFFNKTKSTTSVRRNSNKKIFFKNASYKGGINYNKKNIKKKIQNQKLKKKNLRNIVIKGLKNSRYFNNISNINNNRKNIPINYTKSINNNGSKIFESYRSFKKNNLFIEDDNNVIIGNNKNNNKLKTLEETSLMNDNRIKCKIQNFNINYINIGNTSSGNLSTHRTNSKNKDSLELKNSFLLVKMDDIKKIFENNLYQQKFIKKNLNKNKININTINNSSKGKNQQKKKSAIFYTRKNKSNKIFRKCIIEKDKLLHTSNRCMKKNIKTNEKKIKNKIHSFLTHSPSDNSQTFTLQNVTSQNNIKDRKNNIFKNFSKMLLDEENINKNTFYKKISKNKRIQSKRNQKNFIEKERLKNKNNNDIQKIIEKNYNKSSLNLRNLRKNSKNK